MNSCLIIRYTLINEYEVLRYLPEWIMNNDRVIVDEYIKDLREEYPNDRIMLLEIKEDYYKDTFYDFQLQKWLKIE